MRRESFMKCTDLDHHNDGGTFQCYVQIENDRSFFKLTVRPNNDRWEHFIFVEME